MCSGPSLGAPGASTSWVLGSVSGWVLVPLATAGRPASWGWALRLRGASGDTAQGEFALGVEGSINWYRGSRAGRWGGRGAGPRPRAG